MRKYVAEATGAFFIVVSLGISTDAIGIGFTFAALYMIFSGTSGGHFNPAVSLAFLIKRDITPKQFGGYFLSQTVGVFLGAALILYLSGFVVYAEPPSSTKQAPPPSTVTVSPAGMLCVLRISKALVPSSRHRCLLPQWRTDPCKRKASRVQRDACTSIHRHTG